MAAERFKLPRARTDVVTQELPDELLVYDTVRHKAHCLNRSAALVFRRCDGKTSLGEVAAELGAAGLPDDVQMVETALGQLEKAHLLAEPVSLPGAIESRSRRALLKKMGMVAGAALAIPLVKSIVAPTVASAASCLGGGAPCTLGSQCCSGTCFHGNCR